MCSLAATAGARGAGTGGVGSTDGVATDGVVATGFGLDAGSTHSDFGGGGVFINSDQRVSMTLFFSAGGGATGSDDAGAATGPVPVHPPNDFRQFEQHSPSGLGSPQTAHNRGDKDGPSAAAAETRSRPQHTQWRSGECVSF
jgi:hypothetical protein